MITQPSIPISAHPPCRSSRRASAPAVFAIARAPGAFRRWFRIVLQHEILGRQIGCWRRSGLARLLLLGLLARRRARRLLRNARASTPRRAAAPAIARARGVLDIEVAHEFLELVARELLAGRLRRDQAAAPRALALLRWLDVDRFAAERRRVCRHGADFADDPHPAAAVDRLALLPVRQHRRGDEDRRVGARSDADDQREREVLQRFPTEQEQRDDRKQRAEALSQ